MSALRVVRRGPSPLLGPQAKWLIESARKRNVVDLTVVLSDRFPVWWPGRAAGTHANPYLKVPFLYDPKVGAYTQVTHEMDSHSGTHLVCPSRRITARRFQQWKLCSRSAEVACRV